MAKKKTTKKKPMVTKRRTPKGMEPHEWGIWILSTGLLIIVTGLLYGYLALYVDDMFLILGFIPFALKESISLFVMTLWILISAVYIIPKFKRD